MRAGACIPTGSTAHKPPSPLARSSEFTVDSDSEMTEFSEVYESGINVEPENVAPSAATHPVSPPPSCHS